MPKALIFREFRYRSPGPARFPRTYVGTGFLVRIVSNRPYQAAGSSYPSKQNNDVPLFRQPWAGPALFCSVLPRTKGQVRANIGLCLVYFDIVEWNAPSKTGQSLLLYLILDTYIVTMHMRALSCGGKQRETKRVCTSYQNKTRPSGKKIIEIKGEPSLCLKPRRSKRRPGDGVLQAQRSQDQHSNVAFVDTRTHTHSRSLEGDTRS